MISLKSKKKVEHKKNLTTTTLVTILIKIPIQFGKPLTKTYLASAPNLNCGLIKIKLNSKSQMW